MRSSREGEYDGSGRYGKQSEGGILCSGGQCQTRCVGSLGTCGEWHLPTMARRMETEAPLDPSRELEELEPGTPRQEESRDSERQGPLSASPLVCCHFGSSPVCLL